MFKFCKENIDSVSFYNIKKAEIYEICLNFAKPYSKAFTVPGTRSFHHFMPENNSSIKYKRFSKDENCIQFNIQGNNAVQIHVAEDIHLMDYVACIFDGVWWIGLVTESDDTNIDKNKMLNFSMVFLSNFLGPIDDCCWVPNNNIIFKLQPPSTVSGRLYNITENEFELIKKQLNVWQTQ